MDKRSPANDVVAGDVKLEAGNLSSYVSLSKALKDAGQLDVTGSSIESVRMFHWFSGALSAEVTKNGDVFQVRWNADNKTYIGGKIWNKPLFGGEVLGIHLNETLNDVQKHFPIESRIIG